jgi:hypothetical protein
VAGRGSESRPSISSRIAAEVGSVQRRCLCRGSRQRSRPAGRFGSSMRQPGPRRDRCRRVNLRRGGRLYRLPAAPERADEQLRGRTSPPNASGAHRHAAATQAIADHRTDQPNQIVLKISPLSHHSRKSVAGVEDPGWTITGRVRLMYRSLGVGIFRDNGGARSRAECLSPLLIGSMLAIPSALRASHRTALTFVRPAQ